MNTTLFTQLFPHEKATPVDVSAPRYQEPREYPVGGQLVPRQSEAMLEEADK